ncbi:unnamed protein product [Rhizoctonia solani]|uniref:Fungal-type protein kinase domain-containing protein n=1 Tax=Rhizoctonia solani TaxID=456999 RepID=A0A8H2WXG8_9AGAM|nr:unnamed protein product [Rhizoctonia solani]
MAFSEKVKLIPSRKCDPKPECLLIDLGNGADLKVQRTRDALTERTGTPKFIARSVSAGQLLDEDHYDSSGVDMPSMEETLGDFGPFMHTSGFQVLNSTKSPSPLEVQFTHQLFHDAESTFWVILWALVRSIGEAVAEEENPHPKFCELFHAIYRHFPNSHGEDRRANTPFSSIRYWRSVLHPDLADLGPMLQKMFVYIWPEWAYRTELNPEHVHEALMRLLFAEIRRIDASGTDINIVIGGRKIPPAPPSFPPCLPALSILFLRLHLTREQVTHWELAIVA